MMGFGAGGAATFIELKDTPETYSGQSGKLAKVKGDESGLDLTLLLSFTDWYAGGVPTDFPWVFEANSPVVWSYIYFSPIVKNGIGQYIVYVGGFDSQRLYEYNLDTKQWHRLADSPGSIVKPLALSPNGTKLTTPENNSNILYIYDIETNSWSSSSGAPQMNLHDAVLQASVWADDNDTLWCAVRADYGGGNYHCKCFKYVVSTTTWTQFANDSTPVSHNGRAIGISPDGLILYVGGWGASESKGSKYVIATDTYTIDALTIGGKFTYAADQHKLWHGAIDSITSYIDLSDESLHANTFPANPEGTIASNCSAGIFEISVAIVRYRNIEPKIMSYSGTGMWKLAEKVLTDYNLVVFKKPADGYAILAIDKVSGFTVPVYLMSTLTLPAGTWEFFYPKDGDYTQLVISGSELK